MRAFGRRIILEIINRTFKFPDIHMNFTINFSTDSSGNAGSIKIYNLNNATLERIKSGVPFVLKAGYKDDVATILPGKIKKVKSKWHRTDRITKLIVHDNSDDWVNLKINQTWRKGINAKAMMQILVGMLPHRKGAIEPKKNLTYPKGKIFNTTIKSALEELVKDTESKLHISRNKVYILGAEESIKRTILLNKDTGLIGVPQRIESENSDKKKFKVQSLLNYRIGADSLIKLESRNINGVYRVESGTHDSTSFNTEMEVVKYAG